MARDSDNADRLEKADEETNTKKNGAAPHAGSGLSSGLQPGGMIPGGGPGKSVGSIGTGGGFTGGAGTGSAGR